MTLHTSRRLISVAEYHRMAEVGILAPDEKVELINGEILEKMSPLGSKHANRVRKIDRILQELFGDDLAIISIQAPITLGDFSEPEPDIAILAPKEEEYEHRHPKPEDVYLIIEVADSTLLDDRKRKLSLYASNNINDYWIFNIKENQIEIYSSPENNQYKNKRIITGKDESLLIPILNVEFPIAQLLNS